jgi:hypothetical protein
MEPKPEPKPQRQQQPKPQHLGLPERQEFVDELERLRHWGRKRSERLAELMLSLSQAERSDVVIALQRQIADLKEEIRNSGDRITHLESSLTGQGGKPPIPPIPSEQKQEEYEHQLRLLQKHRFTLRHLLEQAAAYGGITYAPPHVAHQIRDVRQEVAQAKRIIRGLGEHVYDDSVDGDKVDTSSRQAQLSKKQELASSRSDGKTGCVGIISLILAGIGVYMFNLFLGVSFLGGTVLYIVSFICIFTVSLYIAEYPNKK